MASNVIFKQQQAYIGRRNEGSYCSGGQNLQTSNSIKQPAPAMIIHNHFNIIINVSPDTTDERISAIVQKLTTIIDRVN